jgi:hypothetical protein
MMSRPPNESAAASTILCAPPAFIRSSLTGNGFAARLFDFIGDGGGGALTFSVGSEVADHDFRAFARQRHRLASADPTPRCR